MLNAEEIALTILDQEGGGLFAEIHKVISCLIHYEKQLVSVSVDWTNEFFPYKKTANENGWDLYFEPIKAPVSRSTAKDPEAICVDSTSVHHELHDQCCTAPWIAYDQHLPYRKFVHEKLMRYLHLKPDITEKCESYYQTSMKGYRCIGVHARIARAHAWLVPGHRLPGFEDYFKEIDKILKKNPDIPTKIFVASDSHMGIEKFKARYGDMVIYIDAHRSQEEQDPCTMYTNGKFLKEHKDIWHKTKQGYFGGMTALLDCLLLSKCEYLIFTTSNLAFFASYYNPLIKGIYLPKGVPLKECVMKKRPDFKIINPFIYPQ